MHRKFVLSFLFAVAVLAAVIPVSSVQASAFEWQLRPGTTKHALTLSDGERTLLDSVVISWVIPPYIFVRDPWQDSPMLPVYANVSIDKWDTIDVGGYMVTVSGQRVLVADTASILVDVNGRPSPPFPKGIWEPFEWPYKTKIPVALPRDRRIPAPSDPRLQPVPVAKSITAAEGTIADAKLGEATTRTSRITNVAAMSGELSSNPPQIDGGTVDLAGKVITALFFAPGTQTISSFNVQEPITGGNGIKVIPQQPCNVVVGDIVRITGEVTASSSTIAECYVQADTVELTGYRLLPRPAGLSQRATACGIFGLQQALYSDTTVTPAVIGAGLSPVGTRVRVWGRVTWKSQDGTVVFVDDGSALKSTYSGGVRTGIRVIWPQECPSTYQQDDYAEGITGVLGAELSGDSPALPVPVVRVPCGGQGSIIRVKWNSPGPTFDGKTWNTAYHTIQEGINSAADGDEIWVAAGTYEENVTLTSGVRVYGSFVGDETVRQAERSWTANLTTIQGDGLDSVVYIGPGATSATVLDGFTIQGGSWGHYIEELYSNYGGGICCNSASPVISHNAISGNGNDSYTPGGGIACIGGSPTIINNTISNNKANIGGGIFCSQSSPTIAWNLISRNAGSNGGGGVYLDSVTSAVLKNNTITRNSAYGGGGIYCLNSSGRISNNNITHNSTSYYGGGISCYNYESSSVPEIVNNTIAYNTLVGIYCYSSSPIIVNNIVASNSNAQIMRYYGGEPIMHTNCVNGETPYSGWYPVPTQDILDDPLIVGIHLQTGSLCIGTGDNSFVQDDDVDIDGQPRKQPVGDPNAIVDIGADEWCEADAGIITPVTTTELGYFSSLMIYCGN
ncbi:MAG: right-handed parallel beta-helix repeat-containing protein [Armatimonadota bacterium]